ncbi:IMPACT family protein [Maribacter sp. 2210JD10-5]|uniref:IMPACT family protein n=1 Tax=Maribacter sp. 2210JD10-5 TaxID=3386272 RepID=UPI0039BCD01A
MEINDTYRTILKATEAILFKDRKSKFYGYAFPVRHEDEVKHIIEALRKKYPTANHVCYAWQIGVEAPNYRANDDGEPTNSAGMPIYGQIQSFEVTNVLIAVVRVFGGVKLGVGGLISAYRNTAKLALENSNIVEKIMEQSLFLKFGYDQMNNIMRFIKKNNLNIIAQNLGLDCEIEIAIRKRDFQKVKQKMKSLHKIIVDE